MLPSNLNDTDAKTLWKHHIQLTEAECAFRITKDELVLRPIWHHHEDRVTAHILVCFVAYAMWKTLTGWMRGSGLGDAPRSLLDELAKIKSGDIVLPAYAGDGRRHTVRLRYLMDDPDRNCVTWVTPGYGEIAALRLKRKTRVSRIREFQWVGTHSAY